MGKPPFEVSGAYRRRGDGQGGIIVMNLPFQIDLGGKAAVVTGAGGVLCSVFCKALAACGAFGGAAEPQHGVRTGLRETRLPPRAEGPGLPG